MHIIFLLVFAPLLIAAVWMITVQLPFGLIAEGATEGNGAAVLAGLVLAVVIWGGLFQLLSR